MTVYKSTDVPSVLLDSIPDKQCDASRSLSPTERLASCIARLRHQALMNDKLKGLRERRT